MNSLANTPEPPYYAVIFSTMMSDDTVDYDEMSTLMTELASAQDGFLGVESARNAIGITVSYWRDEKAIKAWRNQMDHRVARIMGREKWYASYRLRVAKVERASAFEAESLL